MKKPLLLAIIAFLLCLSGCNKTEGLPDVEEVIPRSLDEIRTDYEADPANIDVISELIDILLLEGNKEEAYGVLLEAKDTVTDPDAFAKLKELAKDVPIRLVRIDWYENDKLDDIDNYRYDKSGRILSNGDTTFFYPDDGGEVYYYTLSSWFDSKRCFDKEGNELACVVEGDDVTRDEQGRITELISKNVSYYDKVERRFTYNHDGLVTSEKSTKMASNSTYTEEMLYEYDTSGNIAQKTVNKFRKYDGSTGYDNYVYKYEYDDNGNLVFQNTKSYGEWSYEYETEYEYDDHGNVTRKKEYKIDNGKRVWTEIVEYTYEYDPLYDVVLTLSTKYVLNSDFEFNGRYYGFPDWDYRKEYIYELVSPDSSSVGLLSRDAVTFVSGNATKAVIKRKITATSIKIRKEPTIHGDNRVGTVKNGEIYEVFDSVYNDGYAWHQIGEDQWIADDGTWTIIVD